MVRMLIFVLPIVMWPNFSLYPIKFYKSWSELPLTRSGLRPAQYLEDGEIAEA